MKKTIIAKVWVKNKLINDFKLLCTPLIDQSRKEPECLNYELYASEEEQGAFIFHEHYLNDEAVAAHFDSAHFKQFFTEAGSMFSKEPVIERY